ncbi:M15 family metallopeptidase [Anaerovorax odorimutans]|uniref:M15 family metallopeptidase n=1 Tax=Anaerovorax odorimutans TaxID=109327 RepID=A0ABT1RMT9_9FIRM|nr:M15 family metallopeptidase [Anaerovorax odorimutans]MCQ4636502.1 M15 family metallopeptidase [Anaerovorax odorimutans]
MGRKKRKRGRIRDRTVIIGLAALALLIGMLYFRNTRQTADVSKPAPIQAAAPIESKKQTQGARTNKKDPLLTLVNGKNPLPKGWKADLVPLEGEHSIDRRAYPGLKKMLEDARAAGLDPLICSSYRTNELQTRLFNEQVKAYQNRGYEKEAAEREAAVWVAVPGTSEHQTGLAADIVSVSNQNLNHSQENTAVQKWLMKNCWKYGFILRYPSDKNSITGIGYEPWHYRYVGKQAAKEIYEQSVCLEEYLRQ